MLSTIIPSRGINSNIKFINAFKKAYGNNMFTHNTNYKSGEYVYVSVNKSFVPTEETRMLIVDYLHSQNIYPKNVFVYPPTLCNDSFSDGIKFFNSTSFKVTVYISREQVPNFTFV